MEPDDYDFWKILMTAIPVSETKRHKIMVFVDGENIANRYADTIPTSDQHPDHVVFKKDVYVWSSYLNFFFLKYDVIRKYYYTSIATKTGMDNHGIVKGLIDELKVGKVGFESPKVFERPDKRRAKGVDISMATDMLIHAFRRNYDIAILATGDGDFVPLVEAIKGEGRRVFLWAFESGLNPELKRSADHYWDIGKILLESDSDRLQYIMKYHGT